MDPASEPLAISCAQAQGSLARFVRRSLPLEEGRAFREHLKGCDACRAAYRQTLSTAARTARQRKARLAEEARIQRRLDNRRRVFAAGRAKPRRFGLRLAIVPALVILALIGWGPLAPPELVLAWERGEVRVGEEHLGNQRPTEVLQGGEYVAVGSDALAGLECGSDRLDFLGQGLILVGPRAGRELRLLDGEVAFEGAWTVATPLGVMTCEAATGTLKLERGRFALTCLEGEVAWRGPMGERRLHAGEGWNSQAAARTGP